MPLFLIVLGASAIGASIALFILRMNPDYVPAEKPSRRVDKETWMHYNIRGENNQS